MILILPVAIMGGTLYMFNKCLLLNSYQIYCVLLKSLLHLLTCSFPENYMFYNNEVYQNTYQHFEYNDQKDKSEI